LNAKQGQRGVVGDNQYIVGDRISFPVHLYHRANLNQVTAVFVHEDNECMALIFEGSPDLDYNWRKDGKHSIANLTARVTTDHKHGIYRLNRIITESAGGRTFSIEAKKLGDLSTARIVIAEEPKEAPKITGRTGGS
jgi:hypothetical protein